MLIWRGRIYHGDACIHMLALLSTPSGAFNRINAAVFRSERASRLLYPILRSGRNATLAPARAAQDGRALSRRGPAAGRAAASDRPRGG